MFCVSRGAAGREEDVHRGGFKTPELMIEHGRYTYPFARRPATAAFRFGEFSFGKRTTENARARAERGEERERDRVSEKRIKRGEKNKKRRVREIDNDGNGEVERGRGYGTELKGYLYGGRWREGEKKQASLRCYAFFSALPPPSATPDTSVRNVQAPGPTLRRRWPILPTPF